MRTDLFDFALPEDRIALRPVSPRDAARLLVVRPGAATELEDRTMRDSAGSAAGRRCARCQRHQSDPGEPPLAAASAAATASRPSPQR